MEAMKVTRKHRTDADKLKEARERVEKAEAALEKAQVAERALIAEIKARRDEMSKLVGE